MAVPGDYVGAVAICIVVIGKVGLGTGVVDKIAADRVAVDF